MSSSVTSLVSTRISASKSIADAGKGVRLPRFWAAAPGEVIKPNARTAAVDKVMMNLVARLRIGTPMNFIKHDYP